MSGTNCARLLKITINNTLSIHRHLHLPLWPLAHRVSFHSLHSWLELPVMAWAALSFVTVYFCAVSTSTSHDPRRVRAGTCAPGTRLHVSAGELELPEQGAGPDRQRIKLWHSHHDSLLSTLWLTNRFQTTAAPPCLLRSSSVYPGPHHPDTFPSASWCCVQLSSPFVSTIPNVCHKGFSFPLCTITCVVPKGD